MIKLTLTGENAVIKIASPADVDHGISIFRDQSITTAMSYLQDSEVIDVESTQVVTVPNPKPNRLRFMWRRVRRAIIQAVQLVRRALTTPLRTRKPNQKTLVERYRYVGNHRTKANAFGRYRSTCETNLALRAARARRDGTGDATEGELSVDIEFMGWVEAYVQLMREEQSVTYQPGRHFICS